MYRFFRLSILILSLVFLFQTVNADGPLVPWSVTIPSANGKYVLVLISPKTKEQQEYISRLRELWRNKGIPAENIPLAERNLQEEIDRENDIRKKYSESGLYLSDRSKKLIWKIDLYDPAGKNVIKVSDDGEHLVYHKTYISPVYEPNRDVNANVGPGSNSAHPNAEEVILAFYSFGKPIRSYKTSDFVSKEDDLPQSMNGNFMWSDEGTLDDDAKIFSFSKRDQQNFTFDITTGNIISGKLLAQSNDSGVGKVDGGGKSTGYFCGGFVLIVSLYLLFALNN